jgi:hypothetical protein
VFLLRDSPLCLTLGSIPAKATKDLPDENLLISPISDIIISETTLPIPGIEIRSHCV